MRRAWQALLWKEWQEAKHRLIVNGAALFGLYLILAVLGSRGYVAIGLGTLPMLVILLFALLGGHQRMQSEWAGNHHVFLLTLPVPAWYVTGMKVLVLMFELLTYMLISVLGLFFAAWASGVYGVTVGNQVYVLPQALGSGAVWGSIAKMLVFYGVIFLLLIVLAQSVFIVGRLAARRRGLVGLAGGFLFLWAFDRLYTLVSPLFRWIFDAGGKPVSLNVGYGHTQGVEHLDFGLRGDLPLASGFSFVLVLLLLFGVVSYILERRMQVG